MPVGGRARLADALGALADALGRVSDALGDLGRPWALPRARRIADRMVEPDADDDEALEAVKLVDAVEHNSLNPVSRQPTAIDARAHVRGGVCRGDEGHLPVRQGAREAVGQLGPQARNERAARAQQCEAVVQRQPGVRAA